MKTGLRFCSALFALALVQGEAPAQSSATRGGIVHVGAEERVRLEDLDGVGFNPGGNTYLLQRLRLNLDITPRSWLKFSFQAQDSRVFFRNVVPSPTSQKDPLDLRIGYIQIGDSETAPVSLRAGRQSLVLGEGRLVADPNWSNVGRTFDGLRVTLRFHKVRLDAFSGASDKICTDGFDRPTPAQHFHGVYGSLDKVVPDATIEPYWFWRLEHKVKGEITRSGKLDAKTAGVRWVGKLPYRFDYGLEMAVQRGRQANEPVSAWAGHWVLGHTLADTRHRPRLFAELNRASGDRNPGDGVHGAFDSLFPSAHDKFGTADQFTWTNILHARSGIEYRIRRGLTVATAYNSFWLASRRTHVGQEADVQVQWKLAARTLIDFGFGSIFPGEYLRKTGRGTAYQCVFLGVTQRF